MSEPVFSLAGKVAVVTGGASGMGEAITRRFLNSGAKVLVMDLGDQQAAVNAAGAEYFEADVSDPAAIEVALDHAVSLFGKLDIMVNNAGIGIYRPLEEIEPQKAENIFRINALGVIYGMSAASKRMTSGGSIINIGSTSAITGISGLTEYSATKGAVGTATRTAAIELGLRNIRVNAINPGSIKTPMADKERSKLSRSVGAITAMGRQGSPDEIAAAAHFFASDDASYVTGQVITVDGGWTVGTMPQVLDICSKTPL
ncbi:SDR family NAD(P)-dependent oxidoreductase [Celeribacter indicus]|uniref:Bacilysin biosynthesis oxidoreductase bacC n=1 Tax=Celeribacter indicus TaxID=1208324 RepID=A0A0B5E680_9RHOB|nr:SDR family oxidoreductase [Celeribacter indicus]AJE47847.1 bacilysin biosynthesis oxidoreductase bacC [Celeribacter indicus]SDW24781.1 3-oxoacyl-[acyl-carrier protein] reductase [Celeribacter indicus]